jgi:D-amino peptidase
MKSTSAPVFIIADIEGSSGCWSRRASEFRTTEWARACVGMSRDINAVSSALFNAGVEAIYIKDFHRTGYNLLPELIDRRAHIIHGYRKGPVPGIGGHRGAVSLLMIGMHAASGSDGFLAHTLTSRIASLEVNGRLMCEAELFASSLALYGVRPVFLSGCAVACRQAEESISGIRTCVIDKSVGEGAFHQEEWRRLLSSTAVESLFNGSAAPFLPRGPFSARITMRDGEDVARALARRWKLDHTGDVIAIEATGIDSLYLALVKMCYLTPAVESILPVGLAVYNAMGRLGLCWVRKSLRACGMRL